MEKYILVLLVVLLIASLFIKTYIGKGPDKGAHEKISAQEAKKMIDSGEDLVILDVRTEEEYKGGHIKDAFLLELKDLDQEVEKKLKDKDKKILVYCRSGNRSGKAAKILAGKGYSQVYDLGGIMSWPYEVVK